MSSIQDFTPWLAVAHKRMRENPLGAYVVQDERDRSLLIEWTIGLLTDERIVEIKRTLVDLGCRRTVGAEIDFLKKNPSSVTTDGFLKVCAPLFAEGVAAVDWQKCYDTLDASLRNIYTADLKKFGEEVLKRIQHDVFIFVTAKDVVTDELVGFVSGGVTAGSALGDMKIISCLVDDAYCNFGIERLLLAGLLKALPSTLRLFTGVRPTNQYLLEVYDELRFDRVASVEYDKNHPIDLSSWILFSYDVMIKGML
ncbi:hypothetical protein FJ366_02025 [Candidatus Dependentiae bacterium]|nr:hypothetical protein [Candidatus Dependentiae bacterium]